MNYFQTYLEQNTEVGFVKLIKLTLVYVEGIPGASPGEIVYFETGEMGQVLSLDEKYVEVLLLTLLEVRVGTRVSRSGEQLKARVGDYLLGTTINPLGEIEDKYSKGLVEGGEDRLIDQPPLGIKYRVPSNKGFETGISLVDLVVPLAKGQRELVLGDRKTGKTQFLQAAVVTQARLGTLCVYGAIGKRKTEIKAFEEFFESNGIRENVVMVASESTAPAGLIYLTPFTAMTVAEYFRDKGHDVLVILDDMTTQAQFYRQITLLARRFPGRSSYPGDIFYLQARVMERAGQFEKGSITCLPVAESLLGDMSGYIQTNLMSMTDGHLFFDSELFNQGKRPAINPFLSVTRVGLQSQNEVVKDLSNKLRTFMVKLEKMKEVMHFGAELPSEFKQTIALGQRLSVFFDQSYGVLIPANLSLVLAAALWSQFWAELTLPELDQKIDQIVEKYNKEVQFRGFVDSVANQSKNLDQLVNQLNERKQSLL